MIEIMCAMLARIRKKFGLRSKKDVRLMIYVMMYKEYLSYYLGTDEYLSEAPVRRGLCSVATDIVERMYATDDPNIKIINRMGITRFSASPSSKVPKFSDIMRYLPELRAYKPAIMYNSAYWFRPGNIVPRMYVLSSLIESMIGRWDGLPDDLHAIVRDHLHPLG